jgi:3,4-dihydroxy 2-butanone 4-phosphate synthase/GTP cyclohydrolase II
VAGQVSKKRKVRTPAVVKAAEAELPSSHGGAFRAVAFEVEGDRAEHLALILGDVTGDFPVLVRVHSKCLTGDALGSMRCDCGPQLQFAMKRIGERGRGILLYMDQEGRGIGLINKLRAYALQDRGHDTVTANLQLGFPDDMREYSAAADMLRALGVSRVQLMTNNPLKAQSLAQHGIEVTERLPIEIPPVEDNIHYLRTKRDKMGHLLSNLREDPER